MNARKIITLIAVLFIITGTLFLKNNKPENSAVAMEGSVDRPTLLDLSAAGWPACREMAKILDGFKGNYGHMITAEKIDLMANMDYAKKYNVRVIPTLVFLNPQGEKIYRHEGIMTEGQLLSKWEELGFKLKKKEL